MVENYPYFCPIFHSVGILPMACLKHLPKYFGSLKPLNYQLSTITFSTSASNSCCAFCKSSLVMI